MFKSLWSSDFFNLWLKCLTKEHSKTLCPMLFWYLFVRAITWWEIVAALLKEEKTWQLSYADILQGNVK